MLFFWFFIHTTGSATANIIVISQYRCRGGDITASATRRAEHKKWLDILEKAFNEKGYRTIREGKMFLEGRHWKEPDLFVLQGNRLFLVLEVIVAEGFRRVLTKVKRIKQRYAPKHIVVFEPVEYLDKEFLPERKEHYKREYLGHYPTSYTEIEEYFVEKWKKEEVIEVSFWNEKIYKANILHLLK
jgi:hypothetical protein